MRLAWMQQTHFYHMINFKLMKIFIFLCFHVHKNSQINHFNSIFKSGKFWGVTILPSLRWISSPRFERRRLGDRDTLSLNSSLLQKWQILGCYRGSRYQPRRGIADDGDLVVLGVHTLQSWSIYMYSHVLGYGHSYNLRFPWLVSGVLSSLP